MVKKWFAILVLLFVLPSFSQATGELHKFALGGGGWLQDVAMDSENPDRMFFAFDIGGVYRSYDGGVTVENVTQGLLTDEIFSVTIVPGTDIVWLGTLDGPCKSEDFGTTWTLMENGMQPCTRTAALESYPVMDVKVDPNNNDIVYASLGKGTLSTFTDQPYYPFWVYKSVDGGENWTGVFAMTISTDAASEALGPIVTSLAIDPGNSSYIYLATSRGLFWSTDAGHRWFTMGRPLNSWVMHDGSIMNSACTVGTCPSAAFTTNPQLCTTNCLPVVTSFGETEANLSDIAVYNDGTTRKMYALIHDNGSMGDSTCSSYRDDANSTAPLTHFVGGPYISSDWGRTWQRALTATDGSHMSAYLRCNTTVDHNVYTVHYESIQVNPTNPEHYFIAASKIGSGLYEHYLTANNQSSWRYTADPTNCGPYDGDNCFEGDQSRGLWGWQYGPWTRHIAILDWSVEHPEVLMAAAGSVPKAVYNDSHTPPRYDFELLDQQQDQNNSEYWTGNGLGNLAALDLVWTDDEQTLLVSTGDNHIIKTIDGGTYWKNVPKPTGMTTVDDSWEIERDAESGMTFASRILTGVTDGNAVIASADDGESWTVIGGDCDTCTTDNDLPAEARPDSIAINYKSDPTHRQVIAGTWNGLSVYNPSLEYGTQWAQPTQDNCTFPTNVRVEHVLTWPENPDYALMAVKDYTYWNSIYGFNDSTQPNNDPSLHDGVYLVQLDATGISNCHKLEGGEDVRAAHELGLARTADGVYSLVVLGKFNADPVIFQTPITFDMSFTPTWTQVVTHSILQGTDGFVDHEAFYEMRFNRITVDPLHPKTVVAAFASSPMFDHASPQNILVSDDGGVTFRVATELDELPLKNILLLKFNDCGTRLYVSPSSGMLYYWDNPFGQNEQPALFEGQEGACAVAVSLPGSTTADVNGDQASGDQTQNTANGGAITARGGGCGCWMGGTVPTQNLFIPLAILCAFLLSALLIRQKTHGLFFLREEHIPFDFQFDTCLTAAKLEDLCRRKQKNLHIKQNSSPTLKF